VTYEPVTPPAAFASESFADLFFRRAAAAAAGQANGPAADGPAPPAPAAPGNGVPGAPSPSLFLPTSTYSSPSSTPPPPPPLRHPRTKDCLREDKTTCYPPGHEWYEITHSGLDPMVERFMDTYTAFANLPEELAFANHPL
jgi:hypothetical protein